MSKKSIEKVCMENIPEILKNFWELGDYDRENAYLLGNIRDRPIKRKRTNDVIEYRAVQYTFIARHHIEYEVCRYAFIAMHRISKKKL